MDTAVKLKALTLLVLGLAVPGVCAAQSPLKSGLWTGSVTPVGGTEAIPLTFDVTVHSDSLGIVIHVGEMGDYTADNGRYADGKITFSFSPPDTRVTCTLERKAEVFAGPCLSPDGDDAEMIMVPPKE